MTDTIAALATPPGEGALAIIRLSGADAFGCAQRVFQRDPDHPDSNAFEPRRAYHGWLVHPHSREPLDEVVLIAWQAPASFTGEDVVELTGHGGRVVSRKSLEAVLAAGSRLAEPGEFTKRAFLNGRMDLIQAEAVADVIRAKTDAAWAAGLRQLRGALSERVQRVRGRLIDLLAYVEAGIDFSEEPLPLLSPEQLSERCRAAMKEIAVLLEDAGRGRAAREGLSVALVGRPNVGKSSLFNALLKEDRAIVTPIPGTTRDVIEAEANFNGYWVRLFDTAGMHATPDQVEQLGVARSHLALQDADVVLWVVDGSTALTPEDEDVRRHLPSAHTVIALNKSDLPQRVAPAQAASGQIWPTVAVSAVSSQGLPELVTAVVHASLGGSESREPPLVTNLRHIQALQASHAALGRAIIAADQGYSEEVLAIEVRAALDEVGRIVGAVTTDDVLGHIFSTFCIGK